jgi:hypothetical protein
MHPYTMSRLAIQHASDMRAAAGRAPRHVTPPRPGNSVRHRAGWALVEIGLRIAER